VVAIVAAARAAAVPDALTAALLPLAGASALVVFGRRRSSTRHRRSAGRLID
jgi:hypothetical protein